MRIETARHLTDNYKKYRNNAKLLGLSDDGLNELLYVFRMIERYRDIDTAKGVTLDRVGKNVSEQRRTKDDEEYRKFIRTRIMVNRSAGDIEALNDIAESLLGDSFLGFRETWNIDKYKNEPAGLVIRARNITTAPELRGDPETLDGSWFLNGEYFLNGGYEYLEEYNPIEAIEYIRDALNRAKTGGVRLYWEIPEIAKTIIDIAIQQKAKEKIKKRSIFAFDIRQGAVFNIKNRVADDTLPSLLNGELNLDGATNLNGSRPKIINKVIIREVAA